MSADHEYTVLDAIRDLLEAQNVFFRTTRFLDGGTRNHVVAAYLRNTGNLIRVLETQVNATPTTTVVMSIPLNVREGGGSFFDPVPIIPSSEQIRVAVENNVPITNAMCTICQDTLTSATRIRHCGHSFHPGCIDSWFSMNPRCPVCRHDIRDGLSTIDPPSTHEDRSMYSDEE